MVIAQFVSILLSTLVVGIYWGPWIALSRSFAALPPQVFVPVVHRMDRNLGSLMTVLAPLSLASVVVTLLLSTSAPRALALTCVAVVLLVIPVIVTVAIEVPIVAKIRSWAPDELPADWRAQRDRWVSFHLFRVIPGFAGLAALVLAAIL
jgi:uncharacterized membrane protein